MKRGDLVPIAVGGDYGKPRPALIIQSDHFRLLESITVLRLTSDLHDFPLYRLTVAPSPGNGLRVVSQIMLDRAIALPRSKAGPVFGHLDDATMQAVSRALAEFLGIYPPGV